MFYNYLYIVMIIIIVFIRFSTFYLCVATLLYMIFNGACINRYGFVAIMAKKTCGNPFCHTFCHKENR